MTSAVGATLNPQNKQTVLSRDEWVDENSFHVHRN